MFNSHLAAPLLAMAVAVLAGCASPAIPNSCAITAISNYEAVKRQQAPAFNQLIWVNLLGNSSAHVVHVYVADDTLYSYDSIFGTQRVKSHPSPVDLATPLNVARVIYAGRAVRASWLIM